MCNKKYFFVKVLIQFSQRVKNKVNGKKENVIYLRKKGLNIPVDLIELLSLDEQLEKPVYFTEIKS